MILQLVVTYAASFAALTERRRILSLMIFAAGTAYVCSRSIVEGTDVARYASIYEKLAQGGWGWNYDVLFWGLASGASLSGVPFEAFYFGLLLTANLFVCYAAQRYLHDRYRYAAFLLIYPLTTAFIFFNQNILRQGLAFSLLIGISLGINRFRVLILPLLTIHFSSIAMIAFRSWRMIAVMIAAVLVLGAAIGIGLDGIWLLQKGARLEAKEYSSLYFVLFMTLSVLLAILVRRERNRLIAIALLTVSFLVMPYAGYRLLFYVQPLLVLIFLKSAGRIRKPVLIISAITSGPIAFLLYSHPSVQKLSGGIY